MAPVINYSISSRQFGQHGRLVRCRECGMVYMNPRPAQEVLTASYATMVDEFYLAEEMARTVTLERILRNMELLYVRTSVQAEQDCTAESTKSAEPPKMRTAVDSLVGLRGELAGQLGRGRLLEIGCATGFFLRIAREHGWDVVGVDPCRWAVDYAGQRFGLSVWPGTLESAAFPDNHFHVVVMLDLVEHLYDPMTTLAETHRVLCDGGMLFLSTPNVASLLATLLRSRWWCIMDEHLNYFSPQTIRLILRKTGFRPLRIQSYPRSFSIGYWLDRIHRWNKPLGAIVRCVGRVPGLEQRLLWLDLHDQMIVAARKDGPSANEIRRN